VRDTPPGRTRQDRSNASFDLGLLRSYVACSRAKISAALGSNSLNVAMVRPFPPHRGNPLRAIVPAGSRQGQALSPQIRDHLRCQRVRLQFFQADELQRGNVCRVQNHRRRGAGIHGLLPPHGAEAPPVAGLEPGKAVLG